MEGLPGQHFREFLRSELKLRSQQNSQYSLRSFAKSMGVSPSGLSMVMGGKKPVTLNFIEKVAQKLKLNQKDLHQHQLSLLVEKSKSKFKLKDFEFIDSDRFSLIKEWYHYAILNLIRTKGFKSQPMWVAKRLGITLGEVQTAVERLEKAGLLKTQKGKWIDLSNKFTTHIKTQGSFEAAKLNQEQLFKKATLAISEVPSNPRNHTGITIAFAKSDLHRAKEFIALFRKQFMTHFDCDSLGDEVYQLSIAFFPLTKLKEN